MSVTPTKHLSTRKSGFYGFGIYTDNQINLEFEGSIYYQEHEEVGKLLSKEFPCLKKVLGF